MIYKKASKVKLRIPTSRGMLAVEQLWDLKLSDLGTVVKNLYEEKKKYGTTVEELAFLEGPVVGKSEEAELAELRFDIAKDIFITRQNESKEAMAKIEKRKEANRLAELIQKKKDEALEGKSIEELQKMLEETLKD